MVYAQRRRADGETLAEEGNRRRRSIGSMRNLGEVPLPPDVGDFRLMSRRVVDAVRQLREQHRFMKGLFAWVGFPSTAVIYDRAPRAAGTHQMVATGNCGTSRSRASPASPSCR